MGWSSTCSSSCRIVCRRSTRTNHGCWRIKPASFNAMGSLRAHNHPQCCLLMLQGKEFVAIPAGSWYNFNNVAQYKQLTLEDAEEKMKGGMKIDDGYQRWIMKAANNGATAFGADAEKFDDREGAAGAGRGRNETTGEDEEANDSDRGDEGEEVGARKNRLGLNKKAGDDEEGLGAGDLDFNDDDDIEKGLLLCSLADFFCFFILLCSLADFTNFQTLTSKGIININCKDWQNAHLF